MQIEIDELTKLFRSAQASIAVTDDPLPWKIGSNYFIRTVTHHYTGKLVAVFEKELVLLNAAWIADNGRFMQAVATGSFEEIEPFPWDTEVIIGRGSVIDAVVISFSLPRSQK